MNHQTQSDIKRCYYAVRESDNSRVPMSKLQERFNSGQKFNYYISQNTRGRLFMVLKE